MSFNSSSIPKRVRPQGDRPLTSEDFIVGVVPAFPGLEQPPKAYPSPLILRGTEYALFRQTIRPLPNIPDPHKSLLKF